MSISSINFSCRDYFSGGSNLSEATKSKLIALGIDPSVVTSESQAQIIIEVITQQKVSESSVSKEINGCSSEQEIISRIKNFAYKLGLSFSANKAPKEMIESLSAKVSELLSSEKNDNGKKVLLKNEFDNIVNDYSKMENNRISIYNSMLYSANMNKYLLGL